MQSSWYDKQEKLEQGFSTIYMHQLSDKCGKKKL